MIGDTRTKLTALELSVIQRVLENSCTEKPYIQPYSLEDRMALAKKVENILSESYPTL